MRGGFPRQVRTIREDDMNSRRAPVSIGVCVALCLSALTLLAGDFKVGGVTFPKAASLEKAYREGLASGRRFESLERELHRLMTSGDPEERAAAVYWLRPLDSRFSSVEYSYLLRSCIRLLPAAEANGLREGLVELGWRDSNQEQRHHLYRTAIASGAVKIWEGRELTRGAALVLAADEGMLEFLGAVQEYGKLLDDPRDPGGASAVERLSWRLRLRAGARDATHGAALQAAALLALADDRFAELMSREPAFRQETLSFARRACEEPNATCEQVRRLMKQQDALSRTVRESAVTPTVESEGQKQQPAWLEALREACR